MDELDHFAEPDEPGRVLATIQPGGDLGTFPQGRQVLRIQFDRRGDYVFIGIDVGSGSTRPQSSHENAAGDVSTERT